MRDGWLSWPCWLTDSGRLNHKVVTHPASSLAQDRESSSAETTSVLTTTLRRQRHVRVLEVGNAKARPWDTEHMADLIKHSLPHMSYNA